MEDKPIERKQANDKSSIYYPVNCPWPSDESDRIRDAALAEYEELSKTRVPIYLLASSHWTSEGYWIEFKEPEKLLGGVVKSKLKL